MNEFFSEGGWTMYPTALFGLVAIVASFMLALRPERRFVPLVVSLGCLTLLTGFLGTMWGLKGVAKATANAAPADMKEIVTACAIQALSSLQLATVMVVIAAMGAVSAAFRLASGFKPVA
jgi:dihydrodipicolinate synthase/N-acetylneuraminate lyase